MKWRAWRIYLSSEGLRANEIRELMDRGLRLIVFPTIDTLIGDDRIVGWYCSRKTNKDGSGVSVRIYLKIRPESEEEMTSVIQRLVDDHAGLITHIEGTRVNETKVNLPQIQEACEIAKEIMVRYPSWKRCLDRDCYDEVLEAVTELRNSMKGFSVEDIDEATHFILQKRSRSF